MITGKAKISTKGWVVILKEIRDLLALEPGDEMRFVLWPSARDEPGVVHLRKVSTDPLAATAGMLEDSAAGFSWTEDLIAEHRCEVEQTR